MSQDINGLGIEFSLNKSSIFVIRISSCLIKYSQVLSYHGTIYHDITYKSATTAVEHEWDFELTKVNPYRAFTGKFWSAYCEHLGANWPYITASHCIFGTQNMPPKIGTWLCLAWAWLVCIIYWYSSGSFVGTRGITLHAWSNLEFWKCNLRYLVSDIVWFKWYLRKTTWIQTVGIGLTVKSLI